MNTKDKQIKYCCWLMHELGYYSNPLDWRDESVEDLNTAINQLEEEYLDEEEHEHKCKYWDAFDNFGQHIKEWRTQRKQELHLARKTLVN